MVASLSAARLDPSAPQPSVESLLHAILPHRAVLHSHADVIVTLTNLADGEARVREALGDDVVIVPYVMPGYDLAKVVSRMWPQHGRPDTRGMVLMNHGLFTFADTTREAYARHVDLITKAEEYLDSHAPLATETPPLPDVDPADLASCGVISAAGPMMSPAIATRWSPGRVRPDLESLANGARDSRPHHPHQADPRRHRCRRLRIRYRATSSATRAAPRWS